MKTAREITKDCRSGKDLAGEIRKLETAAAELRASGRNMNAAKLEGRAKFLRFWAQSAGMSVQADYENGNVRTVEV